MNNSKEVLIEKRVTYTLQINGDFILIENVPARVNEETGEQFFSPATVERLQKIVLDKQTPDYVIETPVYNYAAWFSWIIFTTQHLIAIFLFILLLN